LKNPAWQKARPAPAASDTLVVMVKPDEDLNMVLFKARQQGRTVLGMVEVRNPGPDQGSWRVALSAATDTFDRRRTRRARDDETWTTFTP
jgi:hypothetical protein